MTPTSGTVRLFRAGEFKKGKGRAGTAAPLMTFRHRWPSQTLRLWILCRCVCHGESQWWLNEFCWRDCGCLAYIYLYLSCLMSPVTEFWFIWPTWLPWKPNRERMRLGRNGWTLIETEVLAPAFSKNSLLKVYELIINISCSDETLTRKVMF